MRPSKVWEGHIYTWAIEVLEFSMAKGSIVGSARGAFLGGYLNHTLRWSGPRTPRHPPARTWRTRPKIDWMPLLECFFCFTPSLGTLSGNMLKCVEV